MQTGHAPCPVLVLCVEEAMMVEVFERFESLIRLELPLESIVMVREFGAHIERVRPHATRRRGVDAR